MANPTIFPGDIVVAGVVYARGGIQPTIDRSSLTQESLAVYKIPLTSFRVWDALQTNLPGTSATDDLGLIGGTFATASPTIQTYDLKAAGASTLYARVEVPLPVEYVAGETLILRFHAGMKTTVADNTATLDVQAYESDEEEGISADLCTTAAQDINSLTLADIDFTITPTALAPGDMLDVRIAVAINDAASGTAVKGIIGSAARLCDIKG
ncbi:hypothetical protein LCGC14_2226310 [marine sediment metagenome]|uniref:Uncharacterized protein n=1 Tax=marine sediment metagenome TaxID=412755 RepID=A0A0F9FM45_9ZZZZ